MFSLLTDRRIAALNQRSRKPTLRCKEPLTPNRGELFLNKMILTNFQNATSVFLLRHFLFGSSEWHDYIVILLQWLTLRLTLFQNILTDGIIWDAKTITGYYSKPVSKEHVMFESRDCVIIVFILKSNIKHTLWRKNPCSTDSIIFKDFFFVSSILKTIKHI